MDKLDPHLLGLLRDAIHPGSTIQTLSQGKPNKVVEISEHGVLIETERSAAGGTEPQAVDAWMLNVAWKELTETGRVTAQHMVAADGLNVKRSSAVCALLAHLPGVSVDSSKPIVLSLQRT